MIVTFAALHKRRKEHGRNSRAGSGVKAQTSGKPVRQALVAAGTRRSDALTLNKGVFTLRDPKRIAASLKRSAMRSRRAGRGLPAARKKTLMRAKDALRKQFGKD